jgi:sec-independent protein translocase protein TatA
MDLGWQELVIILVIVIIIFGAGKLPEIGGSLGKGIREFRSAATDETKADRAADTPAAPPATTTTTTATREEL